MLEAKRENVLLFATASAVLAAGVFILWGPTFRQKRRGHVLGLVNLGHTCFLNTLLQALASCPIVLDWLSMHQNSAKQNSLTSSLQKTLQVLNGKSQGEDPYTPSQLIQSLISQGWVIPHGEQDAHELFHVIVATMEEEIQQPLSKVCSLSDAVEVDHTEVQSDDVQRNHSGVKLRAVMSDLEGSNRWQEAKLKSQLPFQGLFTSQLQCMSCKYKSPVHYATFYSLSLTLPPILSVLGTVNEFYTLQELIGHYVANRVVNGVACVGCGCSNTDQVKSLSFGKLPSCLCIHIARTTWEGKPMKRDDHIKFPEILAMDAYMHNHAQQKQLTDSELSRGDETFTSGLINLPSQARKRWYYTSDAEVRETTLQEVLQASAYMLFYTKSTSSVSLSSTC